MKKAFENFCEAVEEAAIPFEETDTAVYEYWEKIRDLYEEAEEAAALLRYALEDAENVFKAVTDSTTAEAFANAINFLQKDYEEAFEAYSEAEDTYHEAAEILREWEESIAA